MPSDEFVYDWTKKLDFRENPFQVKIPRPVYHFFSGYEKERQNLNLFVLENKSFGTIAGQEGAGKTTLLRWTAEHLEEHRGKVKVAFINASKLNTERDLIEGLAEPLLNVYEKSVSKLHQKLRLEEMGKFLYSKLKGDKYLVILLDDIGGLPKRYVSLFKYFFDNSINVQVIAAGTKEQISKSGITGIAEKDQLKINLKGLSYDASLEMLRKRINHYGQEGLFPFQEKMLGKMYDKSNGLPKKFLLLCREKAIKLSLDRKYIKQEMAKLEDLRKKKEEEKQKGVKPGVISIKLGTSEEDIPSSEKDPLEAAGRLGAPDMDEQEKILSEVVEEPETKPELKYEGKKEKLLPLEFEEIPAEEVEPEKKQEELLKELKEEKGAKEEKKEKKDKKKEEEEAKEAEELLAKLAKEFEEA